MPALISFVGLFVLMALAWALATSRRVVNWRLLAWGLGLQLAFGAFVFQVPAGRELFGAINTVIAQVFQAAMAGPRFVFGPLALGPGESDPAVGQSVGFILAFQALPAIIVVSAVIAILYHYGVMQLLVRGFAWLFARAMRLSGAESLCAACNIFVGIEASLAVRPFLRGMTRSELAVVLTTGLATVASNVMGAYYFFLKDQFPSIAGHLVSATLIVTPAALIMSKLMVPETETPPTLGRDVQPHFERDDNVFVAVINGAGSGLQLIFGIVALLIAVVGLMGIANLGLGAASTAGGAAAPWTLQQLLAYPFYPLAWLMGVPWSEVPVVANLLGQRLVLTEFASYPGLAAAMKDHLISNRSAVITAYALCGFAHLPSLAIFVGGTAALCPERKRDLALVGIRALIAATLACLMAGCIAGLFFSGESVLFTAP